MKKFILLFIIFISLFSFLPSKEKAYASEPSFFMRVIDEETAIYKDKYCNELLFYLPYTYYVKILSFNEFSVFVECYVNSSTPSIDGYVKKDLLFNDYTTPDNPYVDLTLTTVTTTVLYSNLSLTNEICYIFENRNLTFYGRATDNNGNYYYFVSYNNKLGYVKENAISPFVIENHPNELTFLPPEEPEIPPETETPIIDENKGIDGIFTIKIIIITSLVFAVIIGFFLALKRKPEYNSNQNYFDENDYE